LLPLLLIVLQKASFYPRNLLAQTGEEIKFFVMGQKINAGSYLAGNEDHVGLLPHPPGPSLDCNLHHLGVGSHVDDLDSHLLALVILARGRGGSGLPVYLQKKKRNKEKKKTLRIETKTKIKNKIKSTSHSFALHSCSHCAEKKKNS
jgi:hypothetical protein